MFTFKRSQYTNLIAKNRSSYITYVTYPGTPGKTYYVTAHCYAANASGSQYTWAGSSAVTVTLLMDPPLSFFGCEMPHPEKFFIFSSWDAKIGQQDM